jgi:hypothetical protein
MRLLILSAPIKQIQNDDTFDLRCPNFAVRLLDGVAATVSLLSSII